MMIALLQHINSDRGSVRIFLVEDASRRGRRASPCPDRWARWRITAHRAHALIAILRREHDALDAVLVRGIAREAGRARRHLPRGRSQASERISAAAFLTGGRPESVSCTSYAQASLDRVGLDRSRRMMTWKPIGWTHRRSCGFWYTYGLPRDRCRRDAAAVAYLSCERVKWPVPASAPARRRSN